MTTAEAAAPKHTESTQQHKRFPSPLAIYRHKFCCVCSDSEWCKPNLQRMLICVLCAILDTTLRNNELTKQRGAHP